MPMGRKLAGLWTGWLGGCLLGAACEAATHYEWEVMVSVEVVPALEVVSGPPPAFTLGAAAPGERVVSEPIPFTVRSNTPWGIKMAAGDAGGRAREFDPATQTYVGGGKALTRSLEWAPGPGGPWSPLGTATVALATARPPTGEAGSTISHLLSYGPSFADEPLADTEHRYQTTLTYTVSVGF